MKLLDLSRWIGFCIGVGLILGEYDVANDGTRFRTYQLVLVVAFVLGFIMPKLFYASAFSIVLSIYIIHIFAICSGVRPPYVESSTSQATWCFTELLPALIGTSIGATIRVVINGRKQ